MKYIAALTCMLLFAIAAPSFANEEVKAKDCSAQAEKITNTAERSAFLKSCMNKVSSPENTAHAAQHRKEEQCNMNANNKKLEGKVKTEYLEHCYNENDFDRNQKPHPVLAR